MRRVLRGPGSARRRLTAWSMLLPLIALTACGNTDQWVQNTDAAAWPGYGGDSTASSYAAIDPAPNLALAWSRPTSGISTMPAAITDRGYIAMTSATTTGCNTFMFEMQSGRKLWCRRGVAVPQQVTPLVDQFDNTYLGDPGWTMSINPENQVRWRFPTIGTPLWQRFAGDGQVLILTHQGQALLLDAHNGRTAAPTEIITSATETAIPPTSNAAGLDDCTLAGPACPIAVPPAVDTAAQTGYAVMWSPGTAKPIVQALHWAKRDGHVQAITVGWKAENLPAQPWGTPVLSADKSTLYVTAKGGVLLALRTSDGSVKWRTTIGYETKLPPSVSPDGTIIVAANGVKSSPLIGFKDSGDKATELFRRNDIANLATVAQVRENTGYAVVGPTKATAQAQVIVFDTQTGATKQTLALPADVTSASGISVGPSGELVVVSGLGEAYAFTSPPK